MNCPHCDGTGEREITWTQDNRGRNVEVYPPFTIPCDCTTQRKKPQGVITSNETARTA